MDFNAFDTSSILLGLLATVLFAECVILFVKAHSLKSKMDAEVESIRADEKLKYEKKAAELEINLKEQGLELKSEYEDLLSHAREAKHEIDLRLSELERQKAAAIRAEEEARTEYARFAGMKENHRRMAKEYADKLASIKHAGIEEIRRAAKIELEKKCAEDLAEYRNEIIREGMRDAEDKSKRILADAMRRMAPGYTQEITTKIVKIPDEAMKGRLIGKDGRNIRSFESAAGASLIIDETPDSVMVSCFDPARREIAVSALESLISDGRINPASIEAAVSNAEKSIGDKFLQWGLDALEESGAGKADPKIAELLGRLNFHLSLNQNTLAHSVETAKLAALIAAEFNSDTQAARRAGLFHDIGKAMASGQEVSHAIAAAKILAQCGESDEVVNAVEAHHNEVEMKTLTAAIVQIADSISSSRPGARMEATEGYLRRVRAMEEIALSFEGVSKAYAIQSGREIRVAVSPDVLNDVETADLAKAIKEKIENSLETPVPVRIVVVRESRFTLTASPKQDA